MPAVEEQSIDYDVMRNDQNYREREKNNKEYEV